MASFVPVNLSVSDVHNMAGLPIGDALPEELKNPPTATDLSSWQQEQYSLDVNAAASLGFPMGSLDVKYRHQVLMFGSSRWKDVTAGQNSYRFGVALRAMIVVTDITGSAALTVPIVAAKVETGDVTATAQLLIRGYRGKSLADEMPAWQSFNVSAFSDYMKSISQMQKQVEGDEANIVPELIWTTVKAESLPPATSAVGTVYGYHAIAQGRSLVEAIQRLGHSEHGVVEAIRAVYVARLGEDEQAKPDEALRTEAQTQLYGLHLQPDFFHVPFR